MLQVPCPSLPDGCDGELAPLVPAGNLVVQVVDEGVAALPLPGAEVVAVRRGSSARTAALTDRSGYAGLNLPEGSYEIRVALPGFRTVKLKRVPIGAQSTVTRRVVLKVEAL